MSGEDGTSMKPSPQCGYVNVDMSFDKILLLC